MKLSTVEGRGNEPKTPEKTETAEPEKTDSEER